MEPGEISENSNVMNWSIRTKILGLLTTLLLSVVIGYLYLSEQVFREDKELLLFDINRSNTEKLANDVDISIQRIIDKMGLFTRLFQISQAGSKSSSSKAWTEGLFDTETDIIGFQLIEVSQGRHRIMRQLLAENKLTSLKLSKDLFKPGGFLTSNLSVTAVSIVNCSTATAPLYCISVPIKERPIGGKEEISSQTKKSTPSFIAFALIDGREWLKRLEIKQGLSTTFVVSEQGKIFSHPHLSWVLEKKDFSTFELFQKASTQKVMTQQLEFQDQGISYLGVFKWTAMGGLLVLSMTEKQVALAASRLLLEKSVLLSLIVITAVIMIGFYFANTLSRPLLRLVRAAEWIGRGNFDLSMEKITTGDEIEVLALEFDRMAKQLKESRDNLVAQEKLAAIGRLARSVGHEFGNILQPIMTKIDIIETSLRKYPEVDDNWQQTMDNTLVEMAEAVQLGATICQDLLTFGREEQRPANNDLTENHIEIQSVILKSLRLLGHKLKKKDIKLEISLFKKEVLVRWDETRMVQVLINLLNNAMEASSDGGRIRINGQVDQSSEPAMFILEVSDTGNGIPEENMGKVFQPMFSTKGVLGNGLGLSVCKQITESYESQISIKSKTLPDPDHGTVITIKIPILANTPPYSTSSPCP